jgi:hypothetical protein
MNPPFTPANSCISIGYMLCGAQILRSLFWDGYVYVGKTYVSTETGGFGGKSNGYVAGTLFWIIVVTAVLLFGLFYVNFSCLYCTSFSFDIFRQPTEVFRSVERA